MTRTIAVVNQKGGTGKTTTTVNVAFAMAGKGWRVLAVDADPQASLTFYFGLDERRLERDGRTLYDAMLGGVGVEHVLVEGNPALIPSGIGLARADAELVSEPGSSWVLKETLAALQDRFDLVVIDCPPTLTLLTVNALAAADVVLVPVKTDLLSSLGVSQLLETIRKVKRRANPRLEILGIVPTLYNARFGHDSDILGELRASFGKHVRIFDPIPRSTHFDRAAGTGQATVTLDPSSPGAVAYAKLAQAIMETIDALED